MKKMEIVKTVSQIVVSVGVGGIVGNAIKFTTPDKLGLFKKVCIGLGSVVLTNMVSDKAVEYSDSKIEEIAKIFRSVDNNQVQV